MKGTRPRSGRRRQRGDAVAPAGAGGGRWHGAAERGRPAERPVLLLAAGDGGDVARPLAAGLTRAAGGVVSGRPTMGGSARQNHRFGDRERLLPYSPAGYT